MNKRYIELTTTSLPIITNIHVQKGNNEQCTKDWALKHAGSCQNHQPSDPIIKPYKVSFHLNVANMLHHNFQYSF